VAETRCVRGLGLTTYWLRKKLIERKEGRRSPVCILGWRGLVLEIFLRVF